MNTTAIRQAIKLYKQPNEMVWLTAVNSALPSGTTDLLRLCASKKQMQVFASQYKVDEKALHKVLVNFIEKVLLKEGNSSYKTLGVDKEGATETQRLHYQLLMKVFHPDRNISSSCSYNTSKISKAYRGIKQEASEKHASMAERSFHEPPKSFYSATQKAEKQLHRTRNTFFAIASVAVISIVATLITLNQSNTPNLIVRGQQEASVLVAHLDSNKKATINHASFESIASSQISGEKMQLLLHDIETAYEKGSVDKIKPILANTPEIKHQSDMELRSKLETLFRITKDRKMVLYDFSWKNVAGKIKGQGKFLSRYLLLGEDEWLTRTGVATITAEFENNDIKITHLNMNDRSIQQ